MEHQKIQMPSISEIEELDIGELAKNINKSLNAFFLYRKEFMKRALANGLRIKMTEMSKGAANSWKKEPRKIKNAYKRLSRKIDDLLQTKKQEKKTFQIVYDDKMEMVPQEAVYQEPLFTPIPSDEYICSLSVDDIAFLDLYGINVINLYSSDYFDFD
ncbi:1503_t:CDS:1, partial [Gigaspora rosea]